MRRARTLSAGDLIAKQVYQVEEITQLYGFSPSMIRAAVYRHELPATIAGRNIVSIKRADLLNWLAERGRTA